MVSERFTQRLRLVSIGAEHAEDLWRLHQEPGIAAWHAGTWSKDEARRYALDSGAAWESQGVHKWIAYDRTSGALVGRGGLSRAVVDGATRLEVGWTISEALWGNGFATEIGRAGLAFAFDGLDAEEVVAFTEQSNKRSIAVMERLGMRYSCAIVHVGEPFVLFAMTSTDYHGGRERA